VIILPVSGRIEENYEYCQFEPFEKIWQ